MYIQTLHLKLVYTMCIPYIYIYYILVYTIDIACTSSLQGFVAPFLLEYVQAGRCPREQLHDSDHVFPFRDTQEIRAELETEQAQLLNQDGTAIDRCKDRVSF